MSQNHQSELELPEGQVEENASPVRRVRKKRVKDPNAPKKPRTEKQILAFKRCQERRRQMLKEKADKLNA